MGLRELNILLLISILYVSSCHNTTYSSFDSETWKNWEESESTLFTRLDMVDDLISNHHIKGKTKIQIEELLGKPLKDYQNKNCEYSYNLGPCREFGISYGILKIKFHDGIVIKVDKYCH